MIEDHQTQQVPTNWRDAAMQQRIKKRYAAEKRFRLFGFTTVIFALGFLVFLIGDVVLKAFPAFTAAEIQLSVTFDSTAFGLARTRADIDAAEYGAFIKAGLAKRFPEAQNRTTKRELRELVSEDAERVLKAAVEANPDLIGKTKVFWLPGSDIVELYVKNQLNAKGVVGERLASDTMLARLNSAQSNGELRKTFNTRFFSAPDSKHAELAGIAGSAKGSLLTLFVTLLAAFPLAIFTAIYLEQFAPKNHLTDFIEVNINNLAAVPSVIYGLLGASVYLGFMEMHRSASLVGGLTLALMTMPTIVIASRAAIKAVPPSIRDGAVALGASPLQAVFHHVLPSAMPGMLTGTIIGMSRALGETAPLLLIGMVGFFGDIPSSFNDGTAVLPVQIYIWASATERLFAQKTSAAILVLLLFLIIMNATAIYFRNRFEKRW